KFLQRHRSCPSFLAAGKRSVAIAPLHSCGNATACARRRSSAQPPRSAPRRGRRTRAPERVNAVVMRQLALRLSAGSEASFASFVPGRNVELVQALQALASGHGAERFVYIWGAPGSGRSHLLHAVGHAAVAAGRQAFVLSAPVDALTLTEASVQA